MARRPTVSPDARQDLRMIADRIGADSPINATRFIAALRGTFARLAANPGIGRARPEFGSDVRSFAHQAYIIFYRLSKEGVVVLRVIHGARDIGQITGSL